MQNDANSQLALKKSIPIVRVLQSALDELRRLAELQQPEAAAPRGQTAGPRYGERMMALLDR